MLNEITDREAPMSESDTIGVLLNINHSHVTLMCVIHFSKETK